MKSAYLLIMLFTLSYPLYKSFEDKINYYSKWKMVIKATLPVAFLFILWDNWFTAIGVWSFNRNFIINIFIYHLPIEEYLFFLFVPFSCLFIYEVTNYFFKNDPLKKYSNPISWALIIISLLLSILYYDRIYPLVLFSSLVVVVSIHLLLLKSDYLGKFYLSFSICTIPFLLVNGLLTGLPILLYNEKNIMGIRIYTIPLEDLFYGMLYLLLITSFYEFLKRKKKGSNQISL